MCQSRNIHCYSSDEEEFCRIERRRSKPIKKSAPPSPPPRTNRRRYPHSDTEESIFYADSTTRSLFVYSAIFYKKLFLIEKDKFCFTNSYFSTSFKLSI